MNYIWTDYYEILGVSREADRNELEEAYYKQTQFNNIELLVKSVHDAYDELEDKEKKKYRNEQLAHINEAYQVITNSEKKHYYDEQLNLINQQFPKENVSKQEHRNLAIMLAKFHNKNYKVNTSIPSIPSPQDIIDNDKLNLSKQEKNLYRLMVKQPPTKVLDAYVLDTNSTELVLKGAGLRYLNPKVGVSELLHNAIFYAFDTNQSEANIKAVELTSFDHYLSSTYTVSLRLIQNAIDLNQQLTESLSTPHITNEEKAVIKNLSYARTLLRRLPTYAPTAQQKLLYVSVLLTASVYKKDSEFVDHLFRNALEIYYRIKKEILGDQEIAYAFDLLANKFELLNKLQCSLKCQEICLKIYRLTYKTSDHLNIASALASLGIILEKIGHSQRGIKFKVKSLEMLQRLSLNPKNKPNELQATLLCNLGDSYQIHGYFEINLRLQYEALKIRLRLYGSQKPHIKIAQSLNNIGSALQCTKYSQEGIEVLKNAITINQKLGDSGKYDLAINHTNIGSALTNRGEPEKAREYLRNSLKLFLEIESNTGVKQTENINMVVNNLKINAEKFSNPEERLKYKQEYEVSDRKKPYEVTDSKKLK